MQLFGRQKIIVYLLGLLCACVYGLKMDWTRFPDYENWSKNGKRGMSGHGGNGGYLKEMMDPGFYPSGFEGWDNPGTGLGMGMQGLGGYPKFGNNGFKKKAVK